MHVRKPKYSKTEEVIKITAEAQLLTQNRVKMGPISALQ